MIKSNEKLKYRNQVFEVGGGVYAVSGDYNGLYGIVMEIRTDEDSAVDTPSIYCVFHPPIDGDLEKRITSRYAEINGKHANIRNICNQEVIMRPTQVRPMKKCRVYQVTEDYIEYLFRSYQHMLDMNLEAPPGEAYQLVYDGLLKTDSLEDVYFIFNCHHPKGYQGRSMTTSDIVEFYDDDGSEFYFCDTVGFEKIPFQPEQLLF